MLISFYNFDAAVEYVASIEGATISPVMQDSEGFDFWLIDQPTHWVDTQCVFDFIPNPKREYTYLGRNMEGVWIVTSPEEGERFKYKSCVPATKDETQYYWSVMSPYLETVNNNYNDL